MASLPPSASTAQLIERVRFWFGLSRAELALYLGVSKALVQGLEENTHRLTPPVLAGLLPLMRQLPSAEAQAAAEAAAATDDALLLPAPAAWFALPPGTPSPDPADLDFRRRDAQAKAARLLRQATLLVQRARVAHRWAAALPELLPPDPADPAAAAYYAALPPDPDAPTRAREHASWLRGWLQHRARPLPPEAVTRYHRLRAQAIGLLTEAAALTEALESVNEAQAMH